MGISLKTYHGRILAIIGALKDWIFFNASREKVKNKIIF
jgi:hypothetical protein